MNERDIARFWVKVEKTEGCWIWTASLDHRGYGRFGLKGKNRKASRIAYEIAYGPPGRAAVLHHCDNPRCVNPDHLWLGTLADNNADMMSKGRHRPAPQPAEQNPHAKFTNEEVRAIRRRYAEGGITQQELADLHHVTRDAIHRIIRRRTYSTVE